MAKPTQVTGKFGYGIYIKRDSKSKMERVGFLFNTPVDADDYRQRHFGDIKRWSIQAIRVNVVPVKKPEKN